MVDWRRIGEKIDIPLRDLFATWRKKSQLKPISWRKSGASRLLSQGQGRINIAQ
jgi:hypothetical protein